jgi:GntR family transcriptional repressor for pyruvate dehydrogenase complex
MPSTLASSIGRVQGRKSYHALADHLRERILSGHLPEGSPLPNERDLGDSTGLSRGSVREALRMLEVEGLLTIKTGRNGGGTIRLPDTNRVSRTIDAYVRGQQISFDTVLEAREALEPAMAALAATNRTQDDLIAIAEAASQLVAAGDDNALFIAANDKWHWAVAQASQNRLLIAVVAALSDLLHKSNIESFVAGKVRRAVIDAHASVEKAIRSRDADAAERRMARHVKSYRQQVAPVAPKSLAMGLP